MITVYTKRSRKGYKEKRYVERLEEIISKKIEANPELADSFKPAETFEELEKMYNLYTSEEAVIEPENPNQNKNNMANDVEEMEDDFEQDQPNRPKGGDEDSIDKEFIDPFNREEPIVRDYVLDGGDLADPNTVDFSGQSSFDEPTSFDEAFVLPDENTPPPSSGGGGFGGGSPRPEREPREEPREQTRINPDFDDMSSGKKRKSTKKFAKYIVETVCMLQEKGFVWYANKDINEVKLVEYELRGEMDLSLLLNMPDGQEVTVKQFFQNQCLVAEQAAVIDEESKADLTDALAEVLLEKGIAPTPTQELMLIAGKIFVGQAITLFTLKASSNAVLSQLRAMKAADAETDEIEYSEPQTGETYTPYEFAKATPQPAQQPQPAPAPVPTQEVNDDEMIRLLENNDPLGSEIETLE
jgi:hypothetical protein